jgi:hypothetical protein
VTTVDTVTAANSFFASAGKPSAPASTQAAAVEGAATPTAVTPPARVARGDSHPEHGNPGAHRQGASLIDFATLRAAQESASAASAGGSDGKTGKSASNPGGLSEAELKMVAELKARDAEVKRHEQAHANAGGQYSGQPSYSYQRGPDGRNYAVDGSTPIDVSPVAGNPEATVRKMEVVKRAAMAPAEPSGQDRAVASRAQAEQSKARAEAAAQRREETAAAAAEATAEATSPSEPGDAGNAAATAYGRESAGQPPTLLAVA